ncbi:MAG TPA: hypothetical protein VM370_00060, partial [Candidatus Thermoplasmatota archaeon]|nr:hypothetical protein [Candidatus Thermoplasmatota archaeon]
ASPIFLGKMCQRGTACQTDPNAETGDRRLGDFFEAAIDAQGYLNVAYAVAMDDSISHPAFSKQMSGPLLRAG